VAEAPQPKLAEDYYPQALEAQKEITFARCITFGLVTVALAALSSVTYCSMSPSAEQRLESLARQTCLQRGMNWLPVITRNGSFLEHEMSCVSERALPGVLRQNSELVQNKIVLRSEE
jgi:hypothetical protein